MKSQQKIPNPAAQALGRLAAGKPKKFSPEELEKRKQRIKAAKRWGKEAK